MAQTRAEPGVFPMDVVPCNMVYRSLPCNPGNFVLPHNGREGGRLGKVKLHAGLKFGGTIVRPQLPVQDWGTDRMALGRPTLSEGRKSDK